MDRPIVKLLQTFEKVLQEFYPANYSKLQQPLDEAVVKDHLVRMAVSDPDLKALYQWRNGNNLDSGVSSADNIFSDGVMMPLERALLLYESDKDEFDHLIPIIVNIDGGYILFNSKKGKGYGKLYCHSASALCFGRQCIAYDSLYSLINTHITAYKNGILSAGKTGRLEEDVDQFIDLVQEQNPKANRYDDDRFDSEEDVY